MKGPKTLYFAVFPRLRKGRRGQKPCIFHCGLAFGKGEATKKLAFESVSAPWERAKGQKPLYFTRFLLLRRRRRGQTPYILQYFRAFGMGEGANNLVLYNNFAPSEKAKGPNTLYFQLFSRLRKGRRGQTRRILQCFRAFGMGERGQTPCIFHCFRVSFGTGEGATNLVFYCVFVSSERVKLPNTLHFTMFLRLRRRRRGKTRVCYNVFAPSEWATGPNTLYFTVFPRLRKGRRGQKPCILQLLVCAFGKGERGQKPCILKCFRAFEKGEGAKHLVFSIVFVPSERVRLPKTLYFT